MCTHSNREIFNSRRHPDCYKWRRSLCTDCGVRFSSYEISADEFRALQTFKKGAAILIKEKS